MSSRSYWSRKANYIAVAAALTGISLALQSVPWRGSAELHTLLEAVATLLALIVGLVALLRYYADRSNTFLFLGVGFVGAAFLDGYHAVLTSTWFNEHFTLASPSLIPWSWSASRIYLALLMVFSWIAWRREQRLGEMGRAREPTVFAAVAALTLAVVAFFSLVPLPRAYYPELFFGRPQEFIPAALFLVALVGYLGKGRWRSDPFEHAVVVSLIVGIVAQSVAMSRSFYLFDGMFDLAHALKIGSYAIVMTGLQYNIYDSFVAARCRARQAEQIERANQLLEQRAQQLLHTRTALVNMMEDSEQARRAVETAKADLAAQARELERSNRGLEQFAYVVSHDLKEPLRMISGYVQLLADEYGGKMGGEADEYLAYAVDGAARMQRMIDDILHYSRVTNGGVAREPVRLEDVVATIRDNLAYQIQESGTSIETGPLPCVSASPTLMEQLFQNLVANAIKFRSARPPRIRIDCRRQQHQWLVRVADNGIGVEPRYHERIFGIFQRLHTRSEYEGTGIGLAVCKKIVECHDGEIRVESQPGEGTTFLFTLPVDAGQTPGLQDPVGEPADEPLEGAATRVTPCPAPPHDESAVALPG